jgi:hypothetical protein
MICIQLSFISGTGQPIGSALTSLATYHGMMLRLTLSSPMRDDTKRKQ